MVQPIRGLRNVDRVRLIGSLQQIESETRRLQDEAGALQNQQESQSAADVSYDNATSGLGAATVQGALDTIASDSPSYATSNVTTDRTLDANAASGAISSPPTQAEVEALRDAVLELSDVVATLIEDLKAKAVLGGP